MNTTIKRYYSYSELASSQGDFIPMYGETREEKPDMDNDIEATVSANESYADTSNAATDTAKDPATHYTANPLNAPNCKRCLKSGLLSEHTHDPKQQTMHLSLKIYD